jgi:hypothetical protein
MRSTLTAALAAGLLLAGCGATASTPAPVESESASGAVAGTVADCKEGPPAELFKANTYSHDGVVGTMRNTGTRDLVVALATEWPGTPEDPKTPRCYLAPGKGVVFALGGGATYREVTGRFVVYDRECMTCLRTRRRRAAIAGTGRLSRSAIPSWEEWKSTWAATT